MRLLLCAITAMFAFKALHCAAQTFVEAEIPWDVQQKYTSFFTCSIGCTLASACTAFSFDITNGCHHGLADPEQPAPLATVHVETTTLAKLRVSQKQGLQWSKFSSWTALAVGNILLAVAPSWRRFNESRAECLRHGGHLTTSIRHEHVWKPLVAWFSGGVWVGLDSSSSTGCKKEECNGLWVWDDGTEFVHENFMSCTDQRTTRAYGIILASGKKHCGLATPQTILYDCAFPTSKMKPLCEFEV